MLRGLSPLPCSLPKTFLLILQVCESRLTVDITPDLHDIYTKKKR